MKILFIIGISALIFYILITGIFLIKKWISDIKNIHEFKKMWWKGMEILVVNTLVSFIIIGFITAPAFVVVH